MKMRKFPAVSGTRRNPHCWSNLPLDLMQMYCLLFNPENKEKIYKTQPLGVDLKDRTCVATCRSWLLMEPPFRGRERRFYIIDVVTRERINLPGVVIESDRLIYFLPVRSLRSPILWIDEKTKDYLVIRLVDDEALVCFKKGDDSWKQIPQLPFSCIYTCFHMVYKDHKLYCLNYDDLHIFDFSGGIPLQVSRISVHGYVKREKWFGIISCRNWGMNVVRRKNNVVVTVGGDVLIMASTASALAQSPPRKFPAVSGTRRNPHCWSNLPLDLMQMVFERLGFTDFERAKSVCSSWQSGSRQSQPKNQIPWMIIFTWHKNYCLLFNPEDKEELYKTQPLDDDGLEDRTCVATCRSWLLMEPPNGGRERRFYILDVLTRERINLPGIEIESDRLIYLLPVRRLWSPILWVDEKTKDYIVIGLVGDEALVCLKKGDDSWKQIPQLSFSSIYMCFHMVYKDHKLYCLNYDDLHIFDFSGDIPLQVSKISVHGYVKREKDLGIMRHRMPWGMEDKVVRRKNSVVVTVRGDVLIVRSKRRPQETWRFRIYKMDSSNGNNWEEIVSLGDEAIVLDLGVTVLRTWKESLVTPYTSVTNVMNSSYSISIQRRLNNHNNLFLRPIYSLML
ncbi:unnamed protein product, partial [Thlaspi arvense]